MPRQCPAAAIEDREKATHERDAESPRSAARPARSAANEFATAPAIENDVRRVIPQTKLETPTTTRASRGDARPKDSSDRILKPGPGGQATKRKRNFETSEAERIDSCGSTNGPRAAGPRTRLITTRGSARRRYPTVGDSYRVLLERNSNPRRATDTRAHRMPIKPGSSSNGTRTPSKLRTKRVAPRAGPETPTGHESETPAPAG
jgi:hypothetical protein